MLNNSLNFELIIKDFISDIEISDMNNKVGKANEEIVMNKFLSYGELIDKDMFSFSYDDFISMFNYYMWLTPSVFANRKCIILRFLDWCSDRNYCTIEYKNDFKNRLSQSDVKKDFLYEMEYFTSLDELNALIDKMIKSEIITEKSYMTLGCVYLAWYGFSVDEITEIPNDAFNYETGEIYTQYRTKNHAVIDNQRVKDLLQELKLNNYEMQINKKFRNGKEGIITRKFKDVGYLIKTLRGETLDPSNVRTMISNLTKLVKNLDITDEHYSKRITFKGVYQSGLYERIEKLENKLGLLFANANLVEFDSEMDGKLLNGEDINDYAKTSYARRIVREYTSFKEWKSTII